MTTNAYATTYYDSTSSDSDISWKINYTVSQPAVAISSGPSPDVPPFIFICPSCNNIVEKDEGFRHKVKLEKGEGILLFCDKECFDEWCRSGKREAMML